MIMAGNKGNIKKPRVLSIQSHVVCGYVGNRTASLCLQMNGFEVDIINTVSFSNHTGYGAWNGSTLSTNEFKDLVEGLKKNRLTNYDYILTGYISSVSLAIEVACFISEMKMQNPSLLYICDPVIGDNNKYYVPEELINVYQDKLIPLAYIITPNQYEAQWLSGINIQDENTITKCMDILHSKGPNTVIITSANEVEVDRLMKCYASMIKDGETIRVEHPIHKLNFSFVGTGDTCAALILATFHKYRFDLKIIITRTMKIMNELLMKTIKKYDYLANLPETDCKMHESYIKELAIVDCLEIIKNC